MPYISLESTILPFVKGYSAISILVFNNCKHVSVENFELSGLTVEIQRLYAMFASLYRQSK